MESGATKRINCKFVHACPFNCDYCPYDKKDKELISKEQIAYEEEMEAIRKSEYAKGEWI